MNNKWTDSELKILSDLNLSNREVADLTERSYSAVKRKRSDLGIKKAKKDVIEWTEEEVDFVVKNKHMSIGQMAEVLGKTFGAVANKRNRMNMDFSDNLNIYKPDDIDFLKENYIIYSNKQLALKLNRSENSIASKLSELGLTRKRSSEYWTADQITVLKQNINKPLAELAAMLEKTVDQVSYKKAHLKSVKDRINRKKNTEIQKELEDNVPLPATIIDSYIDYFAAMEVGQSFVFPAIEYTQMINAKKHFPEKRFIARKISDDEYRVWRIDND